MKGIVKIVKSLDYSGVLLKGITKLIENETKEERGQFLGMLLGASGVNKGIR